MSEPMPKEVATAIAGVMANVAMLGKGEENKHGNYKFASIDDFLEMVRPLCVKAGLIVVQNEEGFEVIDKWLKLTFSFTLITKEGVTWSKALTRSIMVQSQMGAQAFGAAQSYALKQFMRSLFQIATGDGEDADSHTQEKLPIKTKEAAKKELERVQGAGKAPTAPKEEWCLRSHDGASLLPYGTRTAFLDAFEKGMGYVNDASDKLAFFDANEKTLQTIQADAAALKTDKGKQMVDRIALLFKQVHDLSNDIPNPLAGG